MIDILKINKIDNNNIEITVNNAGVEDNGTYAAVFYAFHTKDGNIVIVNKVDGLIKYSINFNKLYINGVVYSNEKLATTNLNSFIGSFQILDSDAVNALRSAKQTADSAVIKADNAQATADTNTAQILQVERNVNTLPTYTINSLNYASRDNLVSGFGHRTGGVLTTTGVSLKPFSVAGATKISLYRTSTAHEAGGLAFYTFTGDATNLTEFRTNAVFVSGIFAAGGVNGIFNVPIGATHAVFTQYGYGNSITDSLREDVDKWVIMLGEHTYSHDLLLKTVKDTSARNRIGELEGIVKRKNLFDNFGIFSWDRKNGVGTTLHSYNGYFLMSSIGADGKTLDQLVSSPDKLTGLGLSQSIKFSATSAFNHSNTWSRTIQILGNLVGDYYRPVFVANYLDALVQVGAYIYTEDLTQEEILAQFKIRADFDSQYSPDSAAYTLTGIHKIKDNTYLIYRNQAIRMLTSSGIADKRRAVISINIPPNISCEFGGFVWWEPANEEEFFRYRYGNALMTSPHLVGADKFDEPIIYDEIRSVAKRFDQLPFNMIKNKKVVVLGTSVPNEPPFGEAGTYKYMEFVGKILGFTPAMRSIGGTKLAFKAGSYYGLSMTLAEETAAGSAKGAERSYETQLDGYWDSDLFYFDHFHNDANNLTPLVGNPDYWDSTLNTFKITSENRFDRSWAVGAFNYIVAEIYRRNPRAVIMMTNDWRAEGVINKKAAQVCADFWGLPIYNPRFGNADVAITTTADTYLNRYNGGADIKLLTGSVATPLMFQTKSAPDESSSVVTEEVELLYTGGADAIHPGRYGRLRMAVGVARFLLMEYIPQYLSELRILV